MPPGAGHVLRVAHGRGRDAARLAPVPRADRREQRRVRRSTRVQQLRVLRRSSDARSRPRVTRSRRCATRCAPGAARSVPRRTSPRSCSTRPGSGRAASATSTPTATCTRSRPRTSSSPAARSRRHGCSCAPGSATPTSSGGTSCTTSRRTCSASSRSGCTRHRGRSVTHLMDDPIVPDDDALAAARDAGLPYFRGGIVEHGGAGQPIMEAIHLPRGELHTALDARLADARRHGRVHDAGRGPPAGDQPHRPRPARQGRLGSRPAG